MMWIYVIGILIVVFGIYQMLNSYKYVKYIQQHGNKTTSGFTGLAVWDSFIFGLGFLLFGIALIVTKGAL